MQRKEFIRQTLAGGLAMTFPFRVDDEQQFVMTVSGQVNIDKLGIVLPHEHIVTDFTGAEKVTQPQYNRMDAYHVILPALMKLKAHGVSLITECTPNYIGRDVRLLQQLSDGSGINIMTNTGYYSAVGQKYLPQHAFDESIDQLAARFLKEWQEGIDGTGIRPGFIKLGVDGGPLKEVEKKIIKAAAQTHLKSGLKIAIHTGDDLAAREEYAILTGEGIAPQGFIWVHAQNDKTGDTQIELAKKGCWVSLDGINATDASIREYSDHLMRLKKNGLLNKVIISHDDGWAVNKNEHSGSVTLDLFKNGNTIPYQSIFTSLEPYLLKNGFTKEDLSMLMIKNPAKAYAIKVCRI
ncbi:MAG: hypothetical protein ABIQ31_05980 [Ferruginibacter sp.]